jgi:hypothetical protein|nr:MAG TPA: hypothetical protein [Caudoviricetes sp.]
MTYEVIRAFADVNDCSEEFPNGRLYAVGDVFPFQGKVSKTRLAELSTRDNSAGVIFIKPLGGDDNGANRDTSSIEG